MTFMRRLVTAVIGAIGLVVGLGDPAVGAVPLRVPPGAAAFVAAPWSLVALGGAPHGPGALGTTALGAALRGAVLGGATGLSPAARVGSTTGATVGGPARGPSLTLLEPRASVGQTISYAGSGFAPSTNIQLMVCGDDALEGSVDCAVTGAVGRTTSESGSFTGTMPVTMPPVPCPCVVAVFGAALAQPVTAALTIAGAPVAPLTGPSIPPRLVVLRAVLEGGSLVEWFGAPAHRVLALTVRDDSSTAVDQPFVTVEVGNTPTTPSQLAPVGPGQVVTWRIPVAFSVLAWGTLRVQGRAGETGQAMVPFDASTLVVPWGLVIVAFVLLQLAIVGLRNRVRGRIWRRRLARRYALSTRWDAGGTQTRPGQGQPAANGTETPNWEVVPPAPRAPGTDPGAIPGPWHAGPPGHGV
jgi:hypothetical protein